MMDIDEWEEKEKKEEVGRGRKKKKEEGMKGRERGKEDG